MQRSFVRRRTSVRSHILWASLVNERRRGDVVGWCGAAMLLAAFGLDAVGAISASSAASLSLNLGGASALAYSSFRRSAYPPAALNIVWAFVAALSLIVLAIRP